MATKVSFWQDLGKTRQIATILNKGGWLCWPQGRVGELSESYVHRSW
jgi:hypothetical protein